MGLVIGIAPFYLYSDSSRPWMCPVQAFALWWILASQQVNHLDGFIFRKKIGRDNISANSTDGMVCMILLSSFPFPLSPFPLLHSLPFYSIFLLPPFSSSPSPLPFLVGSSWWKLIDVTNQTSESFLECFRNNLLDIKVDPRPYGTHLFHRGGCQYFHLTCRWSFQQICNWGGWAEKFDNPGTIFKYLLSWNDNPNAEREHYMNPGRPGTDPCPACGRTCHCA